MIDKVGKSPQSAGDASLLFTARERVSTADCAIPSAWTLKQGAGDLLLYLAARSVRVGVIAGPTTTPAEFESFVGQLRQQSVIVRTAISPAMNCLLYTSPSPRDRQKSRMPSSA